MRVNPYFLDLECDSPYCTLAIEERALELAEIDDITLLTYVHAPCVVIGRNQNAWSECDLSALDDLGGVLARRVTGGGAVYHDGGNLNFSFVAGRNAYNLDRQLKAIFDAAESLGAEVVFSGRNDILCGGKKFSGNAFRHKKHASLHHGTLLINTDLEAMAKCLTVSEAKIKSKGIDSIRSRVINLSEANENITVQAFKDALKDAFAAEYGAPEPLALTGDDAAEIAALARRNASFEFVLGESPKCDASLKTRFPWGSVELMFDVEDGVVRRARAYSDAINVKYIAKLARAFTGRRFDAASLISAARSCAYTPEECALAEDVAAFLAGAGV